MLVYCHFTGEALSSFWRKQITFASGQRRIKPVLCVKGKKYGRAKYNIIINIIIINIIFIFNIIIVIINNNNNMCEMCKLCLTSGSCDRVTEFSQEMHGPGRWLQDSSLSDMKINSVAVVMPLLNSQPPGI